LTKYCDCVIFIINEDTLMVGEWRKTRRVLLATCINDSDQGIRQLGILDHLQVQNPVSLFRWAQHARWVG